MVAETAEQFPLLRDKQRDRAGRRPRDPRARPARAAHVRSVPRRRPHRRNVLPAGGPREPAARGAALRAAGGRARAPSIRTHAAVHAVERERRRRARASRSRPSAGTIRAQRIVNAAGAWANDIAALSGLRFPMRAEGLHVNVTEPRPRLLEPMIQHIGRRLSLKQSANNTFIIGGGWPARPEQPPRALLDTVGERRREHRRRGARRSGARGRPGRAHVDGGDGRSPTTSRPSSASRSIVPGYSRLHRDDGLHADVR